MTLGRKSKITLAILAVVGILAGWQGFRYWWYHAYSRGERTGVVRKVSVKGSPVCKYLEAEMVLIATTPGQQSETWTFSVDDKAEKNPIVEKLHAAERSGARVTVQYRQDLKSWWRCTPHEYFATGVIQ